MGANAGSIKGLSGTATQGACDMCGFIRRTPNSPAVTELMKDLGMDDLFLHGGDFYPGSQVDIVVAGPRPTAVTATWWFLIGNDGKPNHRYATFNARHLDGKLWREPIKTSRCIVPGTAFGESIGEGKAKQSFLLESSSAFLLGGVFRHYETDVGPVIGFAIITCNPHPGLSRYHDKACPLFLPAHCGLVEQWLDPSVPDAAVFHDLIDHPQLTTDFNVTPVQSTRKLVSIGASEKLSAG